LKLRKKPLIVRVSCNFFRKIATCIYADFYDPDNVLRLAFQIERLFNMTNNYPHCLPGKAKVKLRGPVA